MYREYERRKKILREKNLTPEEYEKEIKKIIGETEMKQLDLFHQLKGKSQEDRVMWFLEEYGRISNKQCHEILGIRHAPSVIRNLRKRLAVKDEYEIVNEKKKGCDRFGGETWWDDYVLKKKGEWRPWEN